jgi:hypothetical protein
MIDKLVISEVEPFCGWPETTNNESQLTDMNLHRWLESDRDHDWPKAQRMAWIWSWLQQAEIRMDPSNSCESTGNHI